MSLFLLSKSCVVLVSIWHWLLFLASINYGIMGLAVCFLNHIFIVDSVFKLYGVGPVYYRRSTN